MTLLADLLSIRPKQFDVCFRKHGHRKLGSVNRLLNCFFIQFSRPLVHAVHGIMLLLDQINMNEVWDNIIQVFFRCQRLRHHFVIAETKIRNCLKSLTLKKRPKSQYIRKKTDKNALKKWTLLESQKIVRVDGYLFGSARITEIHPSFV